ncbi:hypothetical protein Trydic_g1407 [Trypoxylus dichotomus]
MDREDDDEQRLRRTRSRRSGKIRRRRQRHEKKESLSFDFNMPGVSRLTLSEKTQKDMGCLVGEDVTSEKPWKFIRKEIFEDHMEMYENSEFLAIRLDLITYPRQEILIGYAPDETREYDEFYIVLAEAAEDKIKEIIEKIRLEHEARLARAIHKRVRFWRTLGSEREINEYTEQSNRPLLEVEMETAYPIISPRIVFQRRPVEAARDGYAEFLSDRFLEITFISKQRLHCATQVAPQVVSTQSQTVYGFPKNAWTQYHYEFTELQSLTTEFKSNIHDYFESKLEKLCEKIRVNNAINLYTNDYDDLITDRIFTITPQNITWDEYMSFADLNEARNKMIASVSWHPIWTGTVAISYADYAPNIYKRHKSTVDEVNKIIHDVNPVLIWCFNDGLHPKLFLESHRVVTVVAFCPFNENLIVGGLQNGQIIIWDIKNKLNKVEEEEILTTAQQKYRVLMFSLMTWMKNTRDFSRVRITAESNIQYSHSAPVTSIKWMTPTWRITKTGQVNEINEGEPYTLQFASSSADGNILFWDLLAKPATSVGDYKPHRKSRRLKVRPNALTLDVSPFRLLNRVLQPQYRLVAVNVKKNKPLLLTNLELLPVHVGYACIGTMGKYNLTERLVCPPIFQRPRIPPQPTLVCSSLDGYFTSVEWDGYDVDPGEVVNQEIVKIKRIGRYHDGPVVCIDRNKLCPDTYVTVGGKSFAIWKESFPHRPIFWRKSRHRYLHGAWNIKNPAMLRLSRSDGNREVWYLIKRTDKMYYEQSLSGNAIVGSYTHPPRGNPIDVLGVADYNGTFRLFYVPTGLSDSEEFKELFQNQLNREVQRKVAFLAWQNNWLTKHQDIVQERWANRLEFQRKREEKALRENQRIAQEKQRLEKEQMIAAQKSVPQPGHYKEWAIEQWRIKEEDRMNKVLLLKKQLNPDLLVSQQMPLKILKQEEERKKKKQKERLQKSEKIFNETVAMLFPDVIKKKPPPPLDPYAGGDSTNHKKVCLEEYTKVIEECKNYVSENEFVYNFDWKKIIQAGRERKKAVDSQFIVFSHKDRLENEKKLRSLQKIEHQTKSSLHIEKSGTDEREDGLQLDAGDEGSNI